MGVGTGSCSKIVSVINVFRLYCEDSAFLLED